MKNDKNVGTSLPTVRTMEFIDVDDLKRWNLGYLLNLSGYNLYEIVSEGVIKLSAGRKKSPGDVLLLDVTGMSDEFRENRRAIIREMEVVRIVGEMARPINYPGKIVSLLPLNGIYGDLSASVLSSLGKEYVSVKNTDKGISIVDVITAKQIPDNMHLRVHPENLDPTIFDVISSEVIELVEEEYGYYRQVDEAPEKQIRFREQQ